MNNIEANRNFASPAVASGLELAGPNSEVSQTQEVINNAQNIALFGVIKHGAEQFADYKGRLGKRLNPKNLMLLGGMGITAMAVACGGGSKDGVNEVSTKPDTGSSAPAVVRPVVESTPAAPAAPAVKVEAPKPNTEVLISGPTEASKAKVREEMSGKLILISTEISALQQPLYEKDSLELHKQRQEEVAVRVKTINDALAKKDVEAARPVLLELKSKIYAMGDPLKGTALENKNMKAEHDPEDKYIKSNRVDPAVVPWYLAIVDMLVATDPTYNGK